MPHPEPAAESRKQPDDEHAHRDADAAAAALRARRRYLAKKRWLFSSDRPAQVQRQVDWRLCLVVMLLVKIPDQWRNSLRGRVGGKRVRS